MKYFTKEVKCSDTNELNQYLNMIPDGCLVDVKPLGEFAHSHPNMFLITYRSEEEVSFSAPAKTDNPQVDESRGQMYFDLLYGESPQCV